MIPKWFIQSFIYINHLIIVCLQGFWQVYMSDRSNLGMKILCINNSVADIRVCTARTPILIQLPDLNSDSDSLHWVLCWSQISKLLVCCDTGIGTDRSGAQQSDNQFTFYEFLLLSNFYSFTWNPYNFSSVL